MEKSNDLSKRLNVHFKFKPSPYSTLSVFVGVSVKKYDTYVDYKDNASSSSSPPSQSIKDFYRA